MAAAPHPDYELSDALSGGDTVGVLRSEPLVGVIVAVEDNICVVVIESLEERLYLGVVTVLAGAEQRVMPDGRRTGCRMGGQVGSQPLLLTGAGTAAT